MNIQHRTSSSAVITALYLLPVIILSAYSMYFMPANKSWSIFSVGIVLGLFGSGILYAIIAKREFLLQQEGSSKTQFANHEEKIQSPSQLLPEYERLIQDAVEPWQRKHSELLAEIERKENESQQLCQEKNRLNNIVEAYCEELENLRSVKEQTKQKERQISELQNTIEEQRTFIEKQREHILSLETKERELTYEIKTLLKFADIEATSSLEHEDLPNNEPLMVHEQPQNYSYNAEPNYGAYTPENASRQLKHYVDIATKMSTPNYLNETHRFRDISVDNYALDLRRLCDLLSFENNCIVILHSQKENKVLFVNEHVKESLGWTPDKFMQNFHEIMQEGMNEWKKELCQLPAHHEVTGQIAMKAKSGQNISLQCHLGAITAGIFRHHAIGLLYRV